MNEDDRALLNFWEAESPDNKLQILISKLQRSTKLQAQKPTCATFALASVFGVWNLRFGSSLELGVWCLVFRSAAAQKPRCDPKTIQPNRDEIFGASPVGLSCTSVPPDSRPACRERKSSLWQRLPERRGFSIPQWGGVPSLPFPRCPFF